YRREVCARVEKAEFVLVLRGKDEEELRTRVYELTAKINSGVDAHHLTWHAGIYCPKRTETDIVRGYHYAAAARATIDGQDSTGVAIFTQSMLDEQIWEHKVEERMEQALADEEFEVYLQPKYNPVTSELSGAEALIRWISPTDGFISPGRFIPIFEKNGFITKIDDYMISHAAAQQAKWIAEGKTVVPVSVNVSRAHFAQPNLAEHIRSLVDRYGIPHNVIEIELTESAFFDDKAALLSTVNRLKEYGFEISMDDFGAGYSSLNSLKDLPLDVLKLDAEFFRGEEDAERGKLVVSEAIKLAKSLDMRVVAEGVEKKEQVDFLAGQGCDMIQGFFFAKPMPIDEFEKKHWSV
ncbi:MAG: putative bifunctional diguanylate cyclase/phosphodiesterase, partial [Oscillospiraceae bacterium]